ncbi:hypothetical protein [Aestuariirhabdus sp. LZHN29]|uniref:hypothetical protein n=1 Tax=Aestuariirhabdus sp. LZHN29 TaxID=3417462 RepID=UPI003CE6FBA9
MKKVGIALLAMLVLGGCSMNYKADIDYTDRGVVVAGAEPVINRVEVMDERGTDPHWLGAIRGGFGNRLKTLRTEDKTEVVVQVAYTEALKRSGLFTESDSAPYRLQVVLTKFDCSYYFNREAHAHAEVALIDNRTSRKVYSRSYRTDEVEPGVGAGIFGDVETLRALAETAMTKNINKMFYDGYLVKRLSSTPSLNNTTKRLKKVEALYGGGLISERDYRKRRAQILSEAY